MPDKNLTKCSQIQIKMEKTNQEIYDKMIEAFNIVLNDTGKLKKDTFEIIDKNNPNYNNIRSLFDKTEELISRISRVENSMKKIDEKLEFLIECNNK